MMEGTEGVPVSVCHRPLHVGDGLLGSVQVRFRCWLLLAVAGCCLLLCWKRRGVLLLLILEGCEA